VGNGDVDEDGMMELVVVTAALALAALGAWLAARWWRARSARRHAPVEEHLLHPDDVAELEAALRRAEEEERHSRDLLLCTRLDLLVSRAVPVRRVAPAAVSGAATVGFADGTALTVTGRRAAEAGVLLMWTTERTVVLHHYCREDGRVVLSFRRSGMAGGLEVVALGLEQPR
jgi:hypothetical protein